MERHKGSKAKETDLRENGPQGTRPTDEWESVLPAHFVTAQEKEKARMCAELHDELGQSLFLLKQRINSIKRRACARDPFLDEDVDATVGFLDEIIENVHRLCQDLSPHIVEDLGLAGAVKCLVLDFAERSGVTTCLSLAELSCRLSKVDENNIYRIIQEALTNIGKHAGATTVVVTARVVGAGLEISIKDDGKGFDHQQTGRGDAPVGLGMLTMAERARMMGGSLEVRSWKGKGTTISFSVLLGDKAL